MAASCCPSSLLWLLCPTSRHEHSVRLHESAELESAAGAESSSSTRGKHGKKFSVTSRRRAAVVSEDSKQLLARTRWKTAFESSRRSSVKSVERITEIVGVLRAHPLFALCDESVLTDVAHAMREQIAREGEAVITQGDVGDKLYVVAEGELAAFIQKGDGQAAAADGGSTTASFKRRVSSKDVLVAATAAGECVCKYGAGDSFGELALLYDSLRAASVRCTSRVCLLYSLNRMEFRNLLLVAFQAAKAGLQQRLGTVPILQGLPSDELAQLAAALSTHEYEAGEYILELGAEADALYLVLQGEVACHQGGGSELRLTDGAFFGESCLAAAPAGEAPPKRQANVVAVSHVRCARLAASDCEAILGTLHSAVDRMYTDKVLASIELFDALSTAEHARLAHALQPRSVAAGEVIIQQGALNDAFFILKSGAVDVVHEAADDPSAATKLTKRGGEATSYFGERSLLKSAPANASVIASEASSLLVLDREAFESILGPLSSHLARGVEQRDADLAERSERSRGLVRWEELAAGVVLGVGSFGCVKMVRHRKSAETFALKGMHKGHLIATSQVDNVLHERRLLCRCHHPFVMACHGAYHSATHVYLLLGLALGGELFTYLSSKGRLDEQAASLYVAMVASAFGFLGARNVAHRDLKLENLLLDSQGYLKLVDFGFAKVIEERSWTFCGTPDYLAPEIIQNAGHNRAVDWWALGVLTYELLHGEPPFAAEDQYSTFQRIKSVRYTVGQHCSSSAKDLIRRLLLPSPAMRVGMLKGGAHDVLRHAFCAHIDVAQLEARALPPPHVPRLKGANDTSHFDSFPKDAEKETARKYGHHLDPKLDELWCREFGAAVDESDLL